MLVVAGVVLRSLLPTPLRILVVHHLPRCVSMGTRSVGLLFLLPTPPPPRKDVLEQRGGGWVGGLYHKWPNQIFPVVNFVFPTVVAWVGGRGSRAGGASCDCQPF